MLAGERSNSVSKSMSQKILIVEDDKQMCAMFARYLSMYGYETTCAEDGQQALTLVEYFQPDLLIVDLLLPETGCTGAEVIAWVKRSEMSSPQIPVIAMTAGSPAQLKAHALNAGCDVFLSKPFELTALMEHVRHYLG